MANEQQTVKSNDNRKTETSRSQIHRILLEFGLDPSDYTFNSSEKPEPDPSRSAFAKYSPAEPKVSQGRPVTYAQQPPPPRPIIKRPIPKLPTNKEMNQQASPSRRTPPSPPMSQRLQDLPARESTLSADDYARTIDSLDNPPVKVIKPNNQDLFYRKEIRIRYLQPPTPPPPAPIIIREKHMPPEPPKSPLLIRERKPEARTPPPLTIRERPPTPPPLLEPYIVDKSIPAPPPPARQVIVERLPTPPPKPRTVIFEKWLPYKKVKRPVLLQKAPPLPVIPPTRNVIIEYEPLKAYTVRRVIEEGVFRVDPQQYQTYESHSPGDVRMVDRIDDLPPPSEEIMRVLRDYNPSYEYSHHNADLERLMNVSRVSHTPVHRHDRIDSPGYASSTASPPTIVTQRSQTKRSNPVSPHSSA